MGNPSVRFDEGRERVGHWPVRLSIQPFPPTLLNQGRGWALLRRWCLVTASPSCAFPAVDAGGGICDNCTDPFRPVQTFAIR